MTLHMSEAVFTHENYAFVTLQDFEVVYRQNSDEGDAEENQGMQFQITDISATEISV